MQSLDGKTRLLRVAAANVRSKVAEAVYLHTGLDLTRPIQIYGIPTQRCNARCRMCDFWRNGSDEELPAPVWNAALGSLRRFVGPYHIQFSAAEPLMKADIFDILTYCGTHGISAGVTTNGMLLNDANTRRLLDSGAFNVNVSIDSLDAEVHDGIRGMVGMLAIVRRNLERLIALRDRVGSGLRIIVRPLICAETLDGLGDLVRYATDLGVTAINAQPVTGATDDVAEMLAVDEGKLRSAIETLIDLKRTGLPIMNSESAIRRWAAYFRNPGRAEVSAAADGRCVVALRNLTILTGGDVVTCGDLDSCIGNIRTDDIAAMWRSDRARGLRRDLTRCRKLCTGTCVEKRAWRDYLALMRKLAG